MADIKDLSIFGSKNKGLQKIKAASNNKEVSKQLNKNLETAVIVNSKEQKSKVVANKSKKSGNNNVGAPIKNYDRIYNASHPIKLSALLNSTSRILNEKYMAGYTRDEILRIALDAYIKMNFTKEDKLDLYRDVTRELNIFREKHPTISKEDVTAKEIEEQSSEAIKNSWGL